MNFQIQFQFRRKRHFKSLRSFMKKKEPSRSPNKKASYKWQPSCNIFSTAPKILSSKSDRAANRRKNWQQIVSAAPTVHVRRETSRETVCKSGTTTAIKAQKPTQQGTFHLHSCLGQFHAEILAHGSQNILYSLCPHCASHSFCMPHILDYKLFFYAKLQLHHTDLCKKLTEFSINQTSF